MNAAVLNVWAEAWRGYVAASLVDGAVALAVAALGWWIVRRWTSPQVGCWLFLLVLVKLVLPGHWPVEIVRPAWMAGHAPTIVAMPEDAAPPPPAPAEVNARTPVATPPRFHAMTGLLAGWAVLAVLGLGRLAWLAARTRRIVRASVPADDAAFDFDALKRLAGVAPTVALRITGPHTSPAVCGLWRPCVLLPRGLDATLSSTQLRWVLLHELFHIRRGDLWFALGQSVLRAPFFFHPAMWLADRAASALRERACDDAALAVGGVGARESADGFLRLLEWIAGGPPAPAPVLGLFTRHQKHQIQHRLMKLNDPTLQRTHRLGWTGRCAIITLATTLVPSLRPVELRAEDAAALRERIAALEKRVEEAEATLGKDQKLERQRAENKSSANKRADEDKRHYKPAELGEIESLYQVANKNWRSDEAKESLKKLLAKYDKANRTGCATLYLGQMSEGAERIEYLTRAVEKFSDCYYFDGCQVGGYGRYVLALTLWESGEKDKARALLGEIKTKYKHATDHGGRFMTDAVEAAEKAFAKG